MPIYMIKYIVNKSLHLCRNYSITYNYNILCGQPIINWLVDNKNEIISTTTSDE